MNSPRSPKTNLSVELNRIINDRNMLSMRSRMKVLHTLNETTQQCVIEKQKKLRMQAIQEILTTEVTYLRQLEILMEFFINPISEKKLLKHTILFTLSENIKTLYNVSGELVQELRQDFENIAEAFLKLAPFFKLYSVYAYDYEQVLTLFKTTQENNRDFRNFINMQETRPEVNRKLPSLLITPIQRVPRYKLLLKEVLQHTPNKHKEYHLLQACLVEIEKAARHINALVAQNEEAQKLLMIQKCIANKINLVKPGRKLIKQGPLMRVSRRGNSAYRRYFILLNDTLLYCKGNLECGLTVSCVLPLNKCKVETVLSGGLFRVTCLDEILLLYSEKDDSNLWLQSLQTAIEKYTECRQTLRKDSSSRKPLRHNNVHQFPSEDIANKFSKRKRLEDDEQIYLNSSKIMYFKKDTGDEEDKQEKSNCFLLVKKLKRFKNNEISKNENIETSIDNVELRLNHTYKKDECSNLIQKINDINRTAGWCSMNKINNIMSSTYTSSLDCDTEISTTIKHITNFFTHIGTSIKKMFLFR